MSDNAEPTMTKVTCAICGKPTIVEGTGLALCGFHEEVFKQSYDDWDTFVAKTKERIPAPMLRMFEYRSIRDLNGALINFAKEGLVVRKIDSIGSKEGPRFFVLVDSAEALLRAFQKRERFNREED